MSIQVVSVLDKPPTIDYLVRGWRAFNKSLQRFGHEPLILGLGSPWKGLGSKPKLLKKAIESGRIKSDYILFCDCLDVVFANYPADIFRQWKTEYPEARILWNAERNCFPHAHWAKHHPETDSPYRFLNSGVAIGRKEDFLQVLTEMKVDEKPDDYIKPDGKWHHENDQEWFMEKFLFGQCAPHELRMEVDSKCELFWNMVGETMDNVALVNIPEAIFVGNELTRTMPSVFHWAGGAKTAGTMEPILKHLDLL